MFVNINCFWCERQEKKGGDDVNSERIKWIEKAYAVLRVEFIQKAPERITITAGFPSSKRKSAIGECFLKYIKMKHDRHQHLITIHFRQFRDPIEVLHVLLHEMIHACGIKGHRKEFSQAAKRVGLVKPWTATTPSGYLKELLGDVVQKLGPLPDGWGKEEIIDMDMPDPSKTQTTRLRKYTCVCGVKVRVASDYFRAICLECDTPFKLDV